MALRESTQQLLVDNVAKKCAFSLSSNVALQKLKDPSVVMQRLSDSIPLVGAIDQQGNVDMQAIQAHYMQKGKSMQDFVDNVIHALERSLVYDLVGLAAYPSKQQLSGQYVHQYVAKKYEIITFPLAAYRAAQTVSD